MFLDDGDFKLDGSDPVEGMAEGSAPFDIPGGAKRIMEMAEALVNGQTDKGGTGCVSSGSLESGYVRALSSLSRVNLKHNGLIFEKKETLTRHQQYHFAIGIAGFACWHEGLSLANEPARAVRAVEILEEAGERMVDEFFEWIRVEVKAALGAAF